MAVNSKTIKLSSFPSRERVISSTERREIADLAWACILDDEYLLPFTAKILDRVRRKTSGESYVKYRRQWIFRIAIQQILKCAKSGEFDLKIKPLRKEEIQSTNAFSKFLFQLPLESRLILILKKRFEFNSEEVGDILELSEGTVTYRFDKIEREFSYQMNGLDFTQLVARSIPEEVIQEMDENAIREIARDNPYKAKEIPGYLKLFLEGVFITFVIVVVIGVIPRGKYFYEKWTSGRLDLYGTFSNPLSPAAKPTGVAPGELDNFLSEDEASKIAVADGDEQENGESKSVEDEYIEGIIAKNETEPLEYQETSEYEEEKELFARYNTGRGQVHRMYVKSPNPNSIKPQVLDILKDAGGTPAGSVELGKEMLGGLYFNFFVKKDNLEDLKKELKSKFQLKTYLNYSKQKIPKGQASVVIFIQQI